MKKKRILTVPEKRPGKKTGDRITAREAEGYLILDIWHDARLRLRHAMDMETGEYGTYQYDSGRWTGENLVNALGYSVYWEYAREEDYFLSKEDRELILRCTKSEWHKEPYRRIEDMEREYGREKREVAGIRKESRIRELMEQIPDPGQAVREWLADTHTGGRHYIFWDKGSGTYRCTACGGSFPRREKLRHKDAAVCPLCGRAVTAIHRKGQQIREKAALAIIHDMDEQRGVERFFRAEIVWNREKGRVVYLDEQIRNFLLRGSMRRNRTYYRDEWEDRWKESNPAQRRRCACYLYPDREGIRAGIRGTHCEEWRDVLPQMAAAGVVANYGLLLDAVIINPEECIRTTEYLFKGRFRRLLRELSDTYGYYSGTIDVLNIRGKSVEEVMRLGDRQLIRRLRQADGGRNMLGWLAWSERTGKKLSDACLCWMERNGITSGEYEKSEAGMHLTPEQLMHYLTRQGKEGYPHRKMEEVLQQYEDYLAMAKELGKDLGDEMVYRPRELKRRHNEASEECRLRRNQENAERKAEEMRRKYPGYEELLEEIRQKYEYGDEEYLIRVPGDFLEITQEGMALHHCVGNTERYFDRIVSRETYICFLRRKEAPDTPFYTIEVEPGGTIRQHRGDFDEEPEIERIKPFLKKWQQEIRRRMQAGDYMLAEKSAALRQKNIQELQEKNNTRVLAGLMEDLMEVV